MMEKPSFFVPHFVLLTCLSFSSAIFASSGTSNSWIALDGPEGGNIQTIAINPQDPDIIYAGTRAGGVFASSRRGDYWLPLNAGLDNKSVNVLVADPQNVRTVYAGTQHGVFKSIALGNHWSEHSTGIPTGAREILALAFEPGNSDVLYAGTNAGIFKSTSGGQQWMNISTSLPEAAPVHAIALAPNSAMTLYIRAANQAFKSDDGGISWADISNGLPTRASNAGIQQTINPIVINPQAPDTLYTLDTEAGIFKTVDAGANWSSTNNNLPLPSDIVPIALSLVPQAPDTLYLGTANSGIFKTVDGGASWQAIGQEFIDSHINTVGIDPLNPEILYAGGTSRGVFVSNDSGVSWSALQTHLSNTEVDVLVPHPSRVDIVYAGTFGAGVFVSSDGGSGWAELNQGLTNKFVHALTMHPIDTEVLYAGTNGDGVFIIKDGSDSWVPAVGTEGTAVSYLATSPPDLSLPLAGLTLYATTFGDGVFKSTDSGANWTSINNGLTDLSVNSIALDPSNPDTLYAATSGQVFISRDGGTRWMPSNLNLVITNDIIVQSVTVDPHDAQLIYAGTTEGIFISPDGGGTWLSSNIGFSDIIVFNLVVNDQGTSVAVYAGTNQGVFKSTDGGFAWHPTGEGLPDRNIRGLAVAPLNPDVIFAGTEGYGAFRTAPNSRDDLISEAELLNNPELSGPFIVDSLPIIWPHSALEFCLLTAEDVSQFPLELLREINAAQLSNFPDEALAALTAIQVEHLNPSAFSRLSVAQLSTLSLDALEVMAEEHLLALEILETLGAAGQDLARFFVNINSLRITPNMLAHLLPVDWQLDMTTGELAAPIGSRLSFRELHSIQQINQSSDTVTLATAPDIQSSFGLGGYGGPSIAQGIEQALLAAGLEGLNVAQTAAGILHFSDGTTLISLMIDSEHVTQQLPQATPGIFVNENNQFVIVTPKGMHIPLIPAPKDPLALQQVINGEIRLGEGGDVLMFMPDGSLQAVLFDAITLPNIGLPPGFLSNSPGVGNGQPTGIIVLPDGSSQQVYPYIPGSKEFLDTIQTILPTIAANINYNNGTINLTLGHDRFLLSPRSTTRVRVLIRREKIQTSITVGHGLTLEYRVQNDQ
ncbi:MAG: hypothetical protein AAF512_01065, partial [Pseudomonadota bacterium]